jgi:predicted GNAT superfamily acetyltransferase
MSTRYRIRDIDPTDYPGIVEINNATFPAMNKQDAESLRWLVEHSAYSRVVADADGTAAFLLGLERGTGYKSPNYRWFCERFDSFLYVDRIAVAERARRRGLGSLLYDDMAEFARGRWPCILAEINVEPPNPETAAFHARHGFVSVGELRHDYDGAHAQVVQMLRRDVPGQRV